MAIFLYILLGIVMVFIAIRFAFLITIRRKKGQAAPDVSGKIGKAIRKGSRTLVYFFSPACPPCIQMSKIVDNVMQKYSKVYKVDVSTDSTTARKFGVLGTPSLVLIEHGKIIDFIMGPQSEKNIIEILK